jgi:CheY-like chemotaxis protein/signal transduction histidine kinase/CHASE3 domain sensor protein
MNLPRINEMKISSRLTAGFGLLIILTVVMGGMALLSNAKLSGMMLSVTDHPFQVSDHAQRLRANILEIDRDIGELVNDQDVETFAANIHHIQGIEQRVRDSLTVVGQFYLGPKEDISRLKQAIGSMQALQGQAMLLLQTGHQAEARALIQPKEGHPEAEAEVAVQKIIDFARNMAASLRTQSKVEREHAINNLSVAMIGLLLLGILGAGFISRSITRPLELLRKRMASLAQGDLNVEVPHQDGATELTAMAHTLQVFKGAAIKMEGQRWIKSNVATLSQVMQAATTREDFAQVLINGLTPLCGGGVGIFYQANEAGDSLELVASYGLKRHPHLTTVFKLGEGLVGQAVLERKRILLTDIPDEYARIVTGTGEAAPRQILVAPVLSQGRVLAVVEIGTFRPFNEDEEALIEELLGIIALNLEIHERNRHTQELLARTQQQAEELRATEEELRAQSAQLQETNKEIRLKSLSLQEQAEELRSSEEELRAQREELQAANEELETKSHDLEEQAVFLENAREDADKRALERDTASRYKSEFLSNMSHELRTPLNSLLILSRSLRDNEDGNLTLDQVDSASIIHDSGTALLHLINDILDLSKVEAGKMEVSASDIPLQGLASSLHKRFHLMAMSKGLELSVEIDPGLPQLLHSDSGKVDQIINNLIANAIKFTADGSVSVHLKRPAPSTSLQQLRLAPEAAIDIEVHDTGIGIPATMLESIFNAFEQADGTTSRRYGGTGLGLTISRRLAQLMGGDVRASSAEGSGSVFTLTLPLGVQPPAAQNATAVLPVPAATPPPLLSPAPATLAVKGIIEDDRLTITPQDEIILVIEDDESFARIVRDLSRQRGFKCLVASDGLAGLDLARSFLPTGIVLDIGLPGVDGWTVMEHLKQHPETCSIPVHFLSATDSRQRGLEMGAVGYLTKPVSKKQIIDALDRIRHFSAAGTRRLLLVEDDASTRKSVKVMLNDVNVEIVEESTGEAAIERLRKGEVFDCMILDLGLPGIGGRALLEKCTQEQLAVPPVVIYSGRDLTDEDNLALKEYTDSIVIKGTRAPERLMDEVTLFLHSVQSGVSRTKQAALSPAGETDTGLAGHTVLVVDDDMRNAFALSKVLRAKGLKVLVAQDGHKALSQLNGAPEIDVVLMDIMMPGMDGYTAIKEIRKQDKFRALPVIALTAKAMVGDREKCIQAGASDYLSKPVDIDALLAALRIQLKVA